MISNMENNKKTRWTPSFMGYVIGVTIILIPLMARDIYESMLPLPGVLRGCLGEIQKIPSLFPGVYFLAVMYLIGKLLYEMGSDAEYLGEVYENTNLSEQVITEAPNIFLRKLVLIAKAPYFLRKSYQPDTDEEGTYCYEKCFEGMELKSYEGKRPDYFFLHHRRWPGRLRILLIGRFTLRRQAVRLLTAQQFDFCESDGRIMKFQKEQTTVRLAYDNFGMSLRGIEICTGEADSKLAVKTQEDREESFEIMLERMINMDEDC